MFNFEIDNDKKMIKINENEEYYDMRKQIQELELELSKAQKEYNDLILYNKRKTEKQKMTKPRFELGTHTVLRCCHNQLDHSAGYFFNDIIFFKLKLIEFNKS